MTFKDDLESEVSEIFSSAWTVREGRTVPDLENIKLGDNDAVKLDATVLYADMNDSTDLVDQFTNEFAAQIYKAYLRCAARIIKKEQGTITAYDGDRIMAVYRDETKNDLAVRSAMKINYAVREIINPLLKKKYPEKDYQLKQVIGIDTSELFVARVGVKNDSDLVWVGRSANYAAKLCNLDDYSTYITGDVFDTMSDSVKYSSKDKELMWTKLIWKARDNKTIYGSSWQWDIG